MNNYGGTRRENGGAQWPQSQSQYFQSYDASHFMQPQVRRPAPTYTAQQKDDAIRLLNEGTPAKTIAKGIGGTCSSHNPIRWDNHQREQERKAEADRQIANDRRELQRQIARQEWIRRRRVWTANFHQYLALLLRFLLIWGERYALDKAMDSLGDPFPGAWKAWCWFQLGLYLFIPHHIWRLLYKYSHRIAWLCVIYHYTIAPFLFPKPKPWYHF